MGESIFVRKKSIDGFDVKLNDYKIMKKWGKEIFDSMVSSEYSDLGRLEQITCGCNEIRTSWYIMILSLIFLIFI